MVDGFCREHLNEEYAEMCVKLAKSLWRRKSKPLLKGRPEGWAAGIVHVIGSINFLSDRSFKPYMKLADIGPHFGVSPSTAANKAGEIRKIIKTYQLDPKWTVPSMADKFPHLWLISVNGLIMDAREAPREIQEAAFRKGLIPYIPADRR
jgi:hypothetical protein